MRKLYAVLAGVVLGLAFHICAQTAMLGSLNNNLTPVQAVAVSSGGGVAASPPDSIVAITAEAEGLTPVGLGDLSARNGNFNGTFWIVSPSGIIPPFPGLTADYTNCPIWAVVDGIYLVDGTGGAVAVNPRLLSRRQSTAMTTGSLMAAAVNTEGNAIADLIEQIQDAQYTRDVARALGMDVPGFGDGGGGGGGSNYGYTGYTFDTNQLWLEITNVSNGWSYLNLHNATNQVYAILTKTNLLDASWTIETEVRPADTNCQPFTVPNDDRQILFFRAMDWTGVTHDGNTVPDWWFWEYYGTAAMSDTNLDSNGNTLVYDYTHTLAPVVYTFAGLIASNNYVSTSSQTVQLDVTGQPYSIAVLVDDTNYLTDAEWNAYSSSNVVVPLGINQGWHEVMIGLRGFADTANQAVWQRKRLKLDWTPPTLVITSPTNGTVDVPLIQLQGYSPEALSSISYDMNNAAGSVSNQPILILDQYYETNTAEFTTNTFQGFDLFLTNGVNTITLHAADLAGNVTTLTTNFTVDYSGKTNPPTVQILWPQDGSLISGSNVTVRGQVADATVTVTAELNGTTVNGIVERNGRFWLENIPMPSGVSTIAITASDVVGNQTVTSLTLTHSTVTVTIDPVNPTNLWNSVINLTGTISDPTYAIWVNGVPGTNNSGVWNAANVPVPPGGVASFEVTVYPPGEAPSAGSGGNGVNPQTPNSSSRSSNIDKPGMVAVNSDHVTIDETDDWTFVTASGQTFCSRETRHYDQNWVAGIGGTGTRTYLAIASNVISASVLEHYVWDGTGAGTMTQLIGDYWNGLLLDYTTTITPFSISIGNQHCNVNAPYDYRWVYSDGSVETVHKTFTRTGQTTMMVPTGGKAISGKMSLWQFNGGATKLTDTSEVTSRPVSAVQNDQITVDSFGKQDINGCRCVALPDGEVFKVTPTVPGLDDYTFGVSGQKYKLHIYQNGNNDVTGSNVTAIVGQKISLTCALVGPSGFTPPPITNFSWTVPGYAISNFYVSSDMRTGMVVESFPTTTNIVSFYWVDGGSKQVSCDVTAGGTISTAQTTFNVLRPTDTVVTHTTLVGIDTWFTPYKLMFSDPYTFEPGIAFSNSIIIPSGFSGTTEWVQIVLSPNRSFQDTNNVWWVLKENGAPPYLDTIYPYTNSVVTANYAADVPSIGMTSANKVVSAADSFKMWLLFKPTGGQWVPLRTVNWNWGGTASLSGTNWVLSGATWSANPPDADAGTAYPQWNSNVTNRTYQAQP